MCAMTTPSRTGIRRRSASPVSPERLRELQRLCRGKRPVEKFAILDAAGDWPQPEIERFGHAELYWVLSLTDGVTLYGVLRRRNSDDTTTWMCPCRASKTCHHIEEAQHARTRLAADLAHVYERLTGDDWMSLLPEDVSLQEYRKPRARGWRWMPMP